MAKNKEQEELIEDHELSSEDLQVYRPEATAVEELEVEEEVYTCLEYIDLEWPAMSLDSVESTVILGTFPDQEDNKSSKKRAKNQPEIVQIEIENTDFRKLQFRRGKINHVANKIRFNGSIFVLSDCHLTKYNQSLCEIAEVRGKYSFGLMVTDSIVAVGTEDGFVEVYDHDLKLMNRHSAGNSPIECVGLDGDLIFAGSLDHTVRILDKNGNIVETIENDSDINCMDVRNKRIAFGDDNGKIHIVNLEDKSREIITWHSSPISFIRWRDDDVFVSGSDEQICIWDITLEDSTVEADTEQLPQNLLFVHQGQRYYKDCAFIGKKVIVTSEDGLCVFEPVSFSETE